MSRRDHIDTYYQKSHKYRLKYLQALQGGATHPPTSPPDESITDLLFQINQVTDSAKLYNERKKIKKQLHMYDTTFLVQLSKQLLKLLRENPGMKGVTVIRSLLSSVIVEKQNEGLYHVETPEMKEKIERDRLKATDALNQFLYNVYSNCTLFDTLKFTPSEIVEKKHAVLKIVSGNPLSVKIHDQCDDPDYYTVSYGDHVTRMQAKGGKESLHTFVIPVWDKFRRDGGADVTHKITKLPPITHVANVLKDPTDAKIHQQTLTGFDYTYLENCEKGCKVLGITLPSEFRPGKYGFNLDDNNEYKTECSVLHMPVKLSTTIKDNLNRAGRRLQNGDEFDDETLYIPEPLAKSDDVLKLIYHTIQIEQSINPERLKENMLLVTLRVEDLESTKALGQSGWHVDGHQGAERIQLDGSKVPIDRVYAISNSLPTEVTDMRLNLNPVRIEAADKGLTLDQYNLQDIIQKSVLTREAELNKYGKTTITDAGENNLFYANPYMLHQSRKNSTAKTIKRSFLRLLFTVDERDRVGDTISPIIGPCYPFKIKNITDIQQLPAGVEVTGEGGTERILSTVKRPKPPIIKARLG